MRWNAVMAGTIGAALAGGLALAATPAAPLRSQEWPQWRGPERNGIAAAGVPLADTWPEWSQKQIVVLRKLWESRAMVPSKDGGREYGFSSPVVSEGRVFFYLNRKQAAGEPRVLTEGVVRQLGWLPEAERPPAELYHGIERARKLERQKAEDAGDVDGWASAWMAKHLTNAATRQAFSLYTLARLRGPGPGRGDLSLEALDALAANRGKTFASLDELATWLDKDMAIGRGGTAHAEILAAMSGAQDVVVCLDADTGKELWEAAFTGKATTWDCSSTCCIADRRCYVLGSGGNLYCLDVKDGTLVWKAPASAQKGSSSPAVRAGRVFVISGELRVYDASTGSPLWTQPEVKHSHSSPVLWDCAGKTYILCNSGDALVCVRAEDGSLAWKTSPGGNNSTPVIAGDYAVVQGEGPGLAAFKLSPERAERLWTLKHFDRGSSPVVRDGYVYAICGGHGPHTNNAKCVKLETGQIMWEQKVDCEISSPVLVGDKIIYLGNNLHMIRATPEKFESLGQSYCWGVLGTTPALAYGRVYVRDLTGVGCWDLPKPPSAGR